MSTPSSADKTQSKRPPSTSMVRIVLVFASVSPRVNLSLENKVMARPSRHSTLPKSKVENRVETINKSSDGESARKMDSSGYYLPKTSSSPYPHSLPIKAFLFFEPTKTIDARPKRHKNKLVVSKEKTLSSSFFLLRVVFFLRWGFLIHSPSSTATTQKGPSSNSDRIT